MSYTAPDTPSEAQKFLDQVCAEPNMQRWTCRMLENVVRRVGKLVNVRCIVWVDDQNEVKTRVFS